MKCFISIGTGHPGIRSVSDRGVKKLLEALKKEATDTDRTSEQFLSRWREHVERDRCFRFNVHRGLENVGLEEFEQQGLLKEATSTYLLERDTKGKVLRCAKNLRAKECTYEA